MATHYDPHGTSEYACGGDEDCAAVQLAPDCVEGLSHEWTRQGCGGIESNPGVWSLGGTAYAYKARCRLCGVERREVEYGYQRNPGQCDEISYESGEYEPEEAAVRRALRLRRRRAVALRRRVTAAVARVPIDLGGLPTLPWEKIPAIARIYGVRHGTARAIRRHLGV